MDSSCLSAVIYCGICDNFLCKSVRIFTVTVGCALTTTHLPVFSHVRGGDKLSLAWADRFKLEECSASQAPKPVLRIKSRKSTSVPVSSPQSWFNWSTGRRNVFFVSGSYYGTKTHGSPKKSSKHFLNSTSLVWAIVVVRSMITPG